MTSVVSGATLPPKQWDAVVECTLAVWRGRNPHVPAADGGSAELCHKSFERAAAKGEAKRFGLLGAAPRGHDVDCAAGGGGQRATCFRALGLSESDEKGSKAKGGRPGNLRPKKGRGP